MRYLFWGCLWLGFFWTIAGISTRIVTATWSPIAIGFLIAGLLVMVVGLLARLRYGSSRSSAVSWWRRRSLQAGTNAIIASTAVIIILAVINIIAIRYASDIDFTENQVFSLAPQTKEVVRQLSQKLKVWNFSEVPLSNDQTLLERYRRINPDRFAFEFVDPQAKPGLAQKYQVLSSNKVVLEFGDRTKTIDSQLSEVELTSAMVALIQNLQITAYFTEGHGEVPLAGGELNLQAAAEALNRLDFTVSPLNLIQQKQIPKDANILIIAGPKRPFLGPEIDMLRTYLKEGGHLFAMVDPEFKTGLEPLLQEWGITLGQRIVIDASQAGEKFGLGPATPLVFEYGDHPITQNFAKGISFYPLAQSVSVAENKGRSVVNLLTTQERSWAEADPDDQKLEFDPKRDQQGPLVLGVAVSQKRLNNSVDQVNSKSGSTSTPSSPPTSPANPSPNPSPNLSLSTSPGVASSPENKTQESEAQERRDASLTRLVVIGDSDFATTGLFSQGINGDVFLNSITWLGDEESSLSIRPKEKTERRLNLSTMKLRLLTLVATVFLPLSAFITAAWFWWKRR